MNNKNAIQTFIISLPKDKERRVPLERQLRDLGVPFSVIDAVHGASLSPVSLDVAYDRKKAVKLFNRELSKGELGCALSHISIYEKMVAEDIPYALILEDDAKILDAELSSTLSNLARFYDHQTPVAVLMQHVSRYDANKKDQLDNVHCVYEAYRGVGAHGYFITKAAAEILVRNIYPVYVVADKWEHFQENFIAVKALVPYSIGLTPASLSSSIDSMGAREKKVAGGKNYSYYMRRYVGQLLFAIRSRPFIKVERQEKSQFDLS